MEYQAKLEAIELEYSSKVDEAVAKVAAKKICRLLWTHLLFFTEALILQRMSWRS